MLSSVNLDVHLSVKVELEDLEINALAEWIAARRGEWMEQLIARVVETAQEQWIERLRRGVAEWVCDRCGVVHSGEEGWRRRGRRVRSFLCSSGRVPLSLVQLSCACGATRTPAAAALGLAPQQRRSAELERLGVEHAAQMSYARSTRQMEACLGVRVAPSTLHRVVQRRAGALQLRSDPGAEVLLCDGTKVRSGQRSEFEDLRMSFQLLGRGVEAGRPRADLRLVGLAVGRGSWPRVLPGDETTRLVLTDAEASVEAHVRARYGQARHQFCLWHVVRALGYSLRLDGVPIERRRQWQRRLRRILWRETMGRRSRAERYQRLMEHLRHCPVTYRQLERAAPHVLFETASQERTTSLIERQMREIDRRVWIGVRWSDRGLENLMRLAMARTHNPDDYQRVWN